MGAPFTMKIDSEFCYRFQGVISAESQAEFQRVLREMGMARTVKLDFSQVTRINSMGIALLLKTIKEIRQTGKSIHLTGANKMTATLFKMMGLSHWAQLH